MTVVVLAGKMVSRLTMWASSAVVRSLPFTCSLLFFNPSLSLPCPTLSLFPTVFTFIPTQYYFYITINPNLHIYP